MSDEIYPPRPKITVPPSLLPGLEAEGRYVLQPKYEESRALFRIPVGKKKVVFSSRHGRAHKKTTLSSQITNEILSLPGLDPAKEYLLDGGIFIRTPESEGTKGKVVFFDILHYGDYLFLKMDQMARLKLLASICGNPVELDPWRGMAYRVTENLMLSPYWESDFLGHFQRFTAPDFGPEVEGVILRKKDSHIDNFGTKEYESDWLIRCRKPSDHSPF